MTRTSSRRVRTFSGGSGEEALLAAAAVQMGNFYGLPTSVGAGMSDSKLPDNQAGFEKALTTALAGHAGANYIGEARVESLGDGIWLAIGYDLANTVLIETEAGNVVVDPSMSPARAREVKAALMEKAPGLWVLARTMVSIRVTRH